VTIVPAVFDTAFQSDVAPVGAEGGSLLHSTSHIAFAVGSKVPPPYLQPGKVLCTHCLTVTSDIMKQEDDPTLSQLLTHHLVPV